MTRRRSVRTGFEQRFLANLRLAGIDRGQRLVVGFSGGADSLALAGALRRVAPLLELSPLLVHIDHALRPDSSLDAERCRVLATELGLPIQIDALEPNLPKRARGLGIEEQARRERYLALAEAALGWNSTTILLAHQANDQAETILLHLFRGTGLRGMSGMALVDERPIPWWEGVPATGESFRILRPLLTESRAEIERYVEELALSPIEDPSNISTDFDRNWIRRQVLPTIEERWPDVVATISRSADALRLDDVLLAQLTLEADSNARIDVRALRPDALKSDGKAIGYRVIRRWLDDAGVVDVGFDVVARIYEVVERDDWEARIEAGSGVTVVLSDDGLTTLEALISVTASKYPILANGEDGQWVVELCDEIEEVDASMLIPVDRPLEVRSLRPGDRWLGTKRSVFEDLRAAGISTHLRDRILAVVAEGGVLLIPAIYPTIRARFDSKRTREVGVRWRKAR